MDTEFLKKVEKKYMMRDTDIRPGDTVKVHIRITEAGGERIQLFEGVVIGVKGSGMSRTCTVRKMSHGIGVEKIFAINAPSIKKIDIIKRGNVRRSKLYYMRDKVGKRSLSVSQDEDFTEIIEEETTTDSPKTEKLSDKSKDSGDSTEASTTDSSPEKNAETNTETKDALVEKAATKKEAATKTHETPEKK